MESVISISVLHADLPKGRNFSLKVMFWKESKVAKTHSVLHN